MNGDNAQTQVLQGSIDAHQHFWRYHPVAHSWIEEEMAVIRKDFLPAQLKPVLQENGIEGCIAVQADQTEAETSFLLQLSQEHDFIKGVVGWVDLRAANIDEQLAAYALHKNIKGFRHVLQGEDPSFMLQPAFLNGISMLHTYGFTYDLLIFPRHLPAALQLVQQFPQQAFVVDHIAKPLISKGLIDDWKKDIQAIAKCFNVYCKISGMVTEADMRSWTYHDFVPYLDVVTEAFGPGRIMYGSDWPVCLAAGSYKAVSNIVKKYFSSFSPDEQQSFFGTNATSFYHLT